MRLSSFNSTLSVFEMNIKSFDVIAGLDWLRRNQPSIDWDTLVLSIERKGVKFTIYPELLNNLMKDSIFV